MEYVLLLIGIYAGLVLVMIFLQAKFPKIADAMAAADLQSDFESLNPTKNCPYCETSGKIHNRSHKYAN